jgi:hypothetical protein
MKARGETRETISVYERLHRAVLSDESGHGFEDVKYITSVA